MGLRNVSYSGTPAGVIFYVIGLDKIELTPSKVNLPNPELSLFYTTNWD